MYQTIYPCTCINISQIYLKEKLKQNSFAYYKGLMSKLRLYSLMSYYIELFTLLGALRAKFRPVYKCLYNKSPGESKFIRTVLFHKDQWTRDNAECCWDHTACMFLLCHNIDDTIGCHEWERCDNSWKPYFFPFGFLVWRCQLPLQTPGAVLIQC